VWPVFLRRGKWLALARIQTPYHPICNLVNIPPTFSRLHSLPGAFVLSFVVVTVGVQQVIE
jgi:hypothetical protein